MNYSDFQFLKFDPKPNGVLLITINRPDAKNAMNKAQAEGISAAMDRLDEEFRSVLVLRDMQELSCDEVAKALGLESDDAGRVFPVNAVLRATCNCSAAFVMLAPSTSTRACSPHRSRWRNRASGVPVNALNVRRQSWHR